MEGTAIEPIRTKRAITPLPAVSRALLVRADPRLVLGKPPGRHAVSRTSLPVSINASQVWSDKWEWAPIKADKTAPHSYGI